MAPSVGATVVLFIVALGLGYVAALFRSRSQRLERQNEELRFALSGLDKAHGSAAAPELPAAGSMDLLANACAAKECVLFVGTGLAAAAGKLTWHDALMGVLRRLQQREPDDALWGRLIDQLSAENYDLVVDLLEERIGRDELFSLLRQLVGPDPQRLPREWKPLQQIGFAGVLSNAWDDLPAQLLGPRDVVELNPWSRGELTDVLRRRASFHVRVYGAFRDESLILTSEAFREHLDQNPRYARFLAYLCSTRSLLFVGAGVASIEDFFTSLGIRGPGRRRHYALVPWSADAALRRSRLDRQFNVDLLPYAATEGHPQVAEFFRALAELTRKKLDEDHVESSILEPLTHVKLTNIGPFDNLELSLDRRWNLILGNNGCGKSAVMRAIALALCGDDERAREAADRVLKVDTDAGAIELRFGENSFRTKLVRDGARVRVDPEQISPVQVGSWLALGFPPLRGASTRAPRAAGATGPTEPSVDDVLPLLTGVADARLDDIKQWIVNEVYAEAANSPTADAKGRPRLDRAPESVKRFFRIASRFTPEVEYEFDELDSTTREVMVRRVGVAGPSVPLHLLSQGIGSVLSWTGILVARIERTGKEAVESDTGIVLVDEIDAHLHPAWQRQIIPTLREEFPNVQFIATTHSPLVVGSMRSGTLWALYRSPEGRIEKEYLPARYGGWRADQILTGPAFDTSSRDVETERLHARYRTLAAKPDPTSRDIADLRDVAQQLAARVPSTEERKEARKARELIEHVAAERIKDIPAEEREQVLTELTLQLQSAIATDEDRE